LAPISTARHHPARITAALSGAAFAVVAMASGAQAAVPAGAAHPGRAHPATASVAGTVEGTAQKLTPATKHRHHPVQPHRHRHLTPRQIGWRLLRYMHWNPAPVPRAERAVEPGKRLAVHAYNPYTGATGIPQAVPGYKMATAGPDWQNNAWTQERWGLRYIRPVRVAPRGLGSLARHWLVLTRPGGNSRTCPRAFTHGSPRAGPLSIMGAQAHPPRSSQERDSWTTALTSAAGRF
jgi:hypothetical protein